LAKVKFTWEFQVTEDKQFLDINLNGGLSRSLMIAHPSFYENIADLLTEINVFQFVHGTKTEITIGSFNELREAYSIHDCSKVV
jgi:hypothetical protein